MQTFVAVRNFLEESTRDEPENLRITFEEDEEDVRGMTALKIEMFREQALQFGKLIAWNWFLWLPNQFYKEQLFFPEYHSSLSQFIMDTSYFGIPLLLRKLWQVSKNPFQKGSSVIAKTNRSLVSL